MAPSGRRSLPDGVTAQQGDGWSLKVWPVGVAARAGFGDARPAPKVRRRPTIGESQDANLAGRVHPGDRRRVGKPLRHPRLLSRTASVARKAAGGARAYPPYNRSGRCLALRQSATGLHPDDGGEDDARDPRDGSCGAAGGAAGVAGAGASVAFGVFGEFGNDPRGGRPWGCYAVGLGRAGGIRVGEFGNDLPGGLGRAGGVRVGEFGNNPRAERPGHSFGSRPGGRRCPI